MTQATQPSIPFHALSGADALTRVDAPPEGLTAAEARRRLEADGPNALPEPEKPHVLRRILSHFNDILVYILLAAAVAKAVLGEWLDFGVVLAVAVINAAVGFIQEGQAERALEGIRTMLSLDAQVHRDGGWNTIPAEDLVRGDVLRLGPGDKVPADARLLEASSLHVDESALTGESVPAIKQVDPVAADAGVGDRACMVFSGTIVTRGSARAVVTATGTGTEIGRIQEMVAQAEQLDTPLARQLGRFGTALAIGILGMAVVMMGVGFFVHSWAPADLVAAAIGFAVAAVPEGLPALVTITLALGVQQMARRRAITRKLTSVETLGAVTTICSDKTGTLTTNEMTVRAVVTSTSRYEVEGQGYAPEGAIRADGAWVDPSERPDLMALASVGGACNEARIVRDGEAWRLVGEPTEGAVASLAAKVAAPTAAARIATIPFDSAHKYRASLDNDPELGPRVRALGAPDRLLDRCTHQRAADGSLEPLDREFWERAIEDLAERGLRTLAAADRASDADAEATDFEHEDVNGLVFLGLFGIVDPPRDEAKAAIAACHSAGIRVKMITGDHAITAAAIARELGILREDSGVLTGAELEAMSQEELEERVRDVAVFARTSPEHKIRIVRALQAHDEVVAMTGDGVNDAPALRRADVGVAMGIKGTEATKEAADIVLADDNFATIERAVEEGRRIYDNIRKSVIFLLPTNGAQSLVILVAVVAGFDELPLSPIQTLWVNLVVGVTLSLALAYEKAEPGLMDRPPRGSGGSVLSRRAFGHVIAASLIIGGATLVVHFMEQSAGTPEAEARTAVVTMLVLGQIVYLFNSRFLSTSSLTWAVLRGNRVIWIAVGSLMALQLLFTYAPFMNAALGSAPIGLREWGICAAYSAGVFLLVEAMKAADRRIARA
ncbi:cation-translocating P-type ATPase [Demequina pelophila]|uniref:cation-translocating P-type ATPase n=1 Tax=Demequina pelophila TaxID=1638984 RepID=UPI0009E4E064|nr:HAD-IC family P-type ATPase [Demequina pelophila]